MFHLSVLVSKDAIRDLNLVGSIFSTTHFLKFFGLIELIACILHPYLQVDPLIMTAKQQFLIVLGILHRVIDLDSNLLIMVWNCKEDSSLT